MDGARFTLTPDREEEDTEEEIWSRKWREERGGGMGDKKGENSATKDCERGTSKASPPMKTTGAGSGVWQTMSGSRDGT